MNATMAVVTWFARPGRKRQFRFTLQTLYTPTNIYIEPLESGDKCSEWPGQSLGDSLLDSIFEPSTRVHGGRLVPRARGESGHSMMRMQFACRCYFVTAGMHSPEAD